MDVTTPSPFFIFHFLRTRKSAFIRHRIFFSLRSYSRKPLKTQNKKKANFYRVFLRFQRPFYKRCGPSPGAWPCGETNSRSSFSLSVGGQSLPARPAYKGFSHKRLRYPGATTKPPICGRKELSNFLRDGT